MERQRKNRNTYTCANNIFLIGLYIFQNISLCSVSVISILVPIFIIVDEISFIVHSEINIISPMSRPVLVICSVLRIHFFISSLKFLFGR